MTLPPPAESAVLSPINEDATGVRVRDDRAGAPRGYERQPHVEAMAACGALGSVFILITLLVAFGLLTGSSP
ncbi:hypothetical protein AB0M36_05785 [Actinoplanes sp. NPDC051346]|uniref:hypothetical protein n=1 Tax=Actinoplanes sp. NPDC051346 TaxID=3155048 RepID=UPI00342CCA01